MLASDFDAHVILRAVRDKQGRITDFLFAEANDKACADNKLTREQLVGHRLLKVFPNARKAGLFDIYVRALETARTVELKGFDYPHDILGGNRKFDIRAVPVGDELAYTWREVTGPPLALERRKNPDWSADADQLVREFQSLARNLLKLREEEQHVVSRELHDNIAQVLSAVTTRISLAKDEKIPAWLRQELLDMREQLQGALADVRTLARELRPSVFDHAGFAAALEKHAEAFRERTRMTLEVRIIPESVNFLGNGDLTHLFRLTQEALQNIEEHSGADNAWINLLERDGAAHLEIGDDGCAFTPERVVEAQRDGHLGLLGMRERAELIGGRFVLEAVPGEGTVINVIIPPRQDNRAANTSEYEL